ncbi:MAG: glycosyltransferase family 9 protein [Acidobacteriota bacterium]|nr:glycosyltransferase family 9 protein [Acidobacteriota bacterium]
MPPLGPILIYRPGGLGDLLTAFPSIRLLRVAFPGRETLLAAAGAPGRLAVRAGLAGEILSLDGPTLAGLFSNSGGPRRPLRRSGAEPDALWAWFLKEPPPEFRTAASRLFGREGRIVVYDFASRLSIGRYFFERTAAALGFEASESAYESSARLPDFGPPAVPLPARPFAVLHPGSGSPRKNAPLRVFWDAAEAFAEKGLDGFFVAGPAETALLAEMKERKLPGGWRLLQELPLADLAGLLARCAAYVGNDSGVTHLAAAAGAPVLALFRDENLPAWRPCGRTAILRASEPSAIPPADMRAALARFPAPSAIEYRL